MARAKKRVSKYWYQSARWRKRLTIGLIIVFSCVVIWGTFLFLSQLGPRKVNLQTSKDSNVLSESVDSVDEKYQKMSAEELKAFSVGLENEAQEQINLGDYEAASSKYQQAFQLQKNINKDYPLSRHSNASRAIRLQLTAKNAAAVPLSVECLDFEQRAESFAKAGNIDSAVEALNRAIAIQQQLNSEHRGARHASTLRLRQLKSRLAELKSGELHTKILNMSERANSLKALGDMEAAGEFFQDAALLQEQLNANFPDSPHASLIRVNEFRQQEQVAQSTLLALELEKKSARLDQLLAVRNTGEAVPLLEELEQEFQSFEKAFPLSPLIDERSKMKIAYLNQKKAQLKFLQNQVYDALLPIPDIKKIHMLSTEIPQSLYVQLMDENPSRNASDSNPVDSVSWLDAKVFCERLFWILGKKVRLPTEEEFRKALHGFEPADVSDLAWCVMSAKGFSQPTGQKKSFPSGYFDLLGNVSEWLESEDLSESNIVYHIGGHVQDDLEAISRIPMRDSQKTERSRVTGFRIVVLD